MTDWGVLPGNGPVRIGGTALPAGQRVYDEDGTGLLAWVTAQPLADPGRAWLALSGAHAETGLVPVLLPGPGSESAEPTAPLSGWDFGFGVPKDITLLDSMPAVDVLAQAWRSAPGLEEAQAPSGHGLPGLAPAGHTPFAAVTLQGAVCALASEQPFRLGLVAARRPADVPALTGWDGNGDGPGTAARSLRISAALRSWEDRFGARLLRMGIDDELWVLAERPPATLEAALLLAAEHRAFADEWGDYADQPVSELAPLLIQRPAWRFWWD